jgi:CHAD domain-containing protein
MASLPPVGYAELATKDDLKRLKEELELKMDALRHDLRGEIKDVRVEVQRLGRTLMLSFVTAMAVMNGILFAALQLAG